jgi:hypothetical protein
MIIESQLEKDCLNWFRKGGWETVFHNTKDLTP